MLILFSTSPSSTSVFFTIEENVPEIESTLFSYPSEYCDFSDERLSDIVITGNFDSVRWTNDVVNILEKSGDTAKKISMPYFYHNISNDISDQGYRKGTLIAEGFNDCGSITKEFELNFRSPINIRMNTSNEVTFKTFDNERLNFYDENGSLIKTDNFFNLYTDHPFDYVQSSYCSNDGLQINFEGIQRRNQDELRSPDV